MLRIVLASGNAHKLEEIREILKDLPAAYYTMKEAGFTGEIVEDGKTFEENAQIKAKAVAATLSEDFRDAIVLADDSGLEIDALNKEPGVYSSRYLGEDTPYTEKNTIILERLRDVPQEERTARFVCAVAAVFPDGREEVVRGTIEGWIGYAPCGENGFGYDPIFYLPGKEISTAVLSPEEKNRISHRGTAFRKMRAHLQTD